MSEGRGGERVERVTKVAKLARTTNRIPLPFISFHIWGKSIELRVFERINDGVAIRKLRHGIFACNST